MNVAVAALDPLSVVVTGDVEEGLELLYRLSAMLMASHPSNGMLFALPTQRHQAAGECPVRRLWSA